MRIARSTIIMGLVTSAAFGLAIRDYVRDKDKPAEPELGGPKAIIDEYSADEYEQISREAELREAQREVERAKERRLEMSAGIERLLAAGEPGLGPAFGTITLGMTDSALSAADEPVAINALGREASLRVVLGTEQGQLQLVRIEARDSDDEEALCELVANKLGEPTHERDDVKLWQGSRGVRVVLEENESCRVTIERFVAPSAWVAKTGAVVPLGAIGQTHAKLVKSLEPMRVDLDDAEYQIAWTAPGIGEGFERTEITAGITKGKVVSLTAQVIGSAHAAQLVVAQLTSLYGAPIDEDGTLTWKKKPGAVLEVDSDGVINLTVGTPPEELEY